MAECLQAKVRMGKDMDQTLDSAALEENNTDSWRDGLWLRTSTGQLPNLFFHSFS